jgi:hypothetical protein
VARRDHRVDLVHRRVLVMPSGEDAFGEEVAQLLAGELLDDRPSSGKVLL